MRHVAEGASSNAVQGRDKSPSPFTLQVALRCASNINITLAFVLQALQHPDQQQETPGSQQATRNPTPFMLSLMLSCLAPMSPLQRFHRAP